MPKKADILEYQRADRIGANPNVSNHAGSTNVEWNGDQATITQTLSPELQGIFDQQVGFVSGGPQQLGNYQNNTLSDLFSQFGGRVAGRAGLNMPMGGLNQPQQMTKPMPIDMQKPALPAQLPQDPQVTQQLGQGGQGLGQLFNGNGGDFGQLYSEWERYRNPNINWTGR